MASNPKSPNRPRRPSPVAVKKQAVELPFDDGEVTPLQADDPRPQRVPQFPTSARKVPKKAEEAIPTSVYEVKQNDEEFQPSYENGDLSDPGFKPAFLYVDRGPGAGQLIPVRQGILVIGRASVSELRLQHPSISRRHAQVTRKGDFFYVKDLGSQNGTYVNRTKIDTEVEVQPGDEIAVGNALLKLRGPVQAADSANVKLVVPRKRKKSGSGAIKVALFAGAVGFGLAAVMMFALLRSQQQKPSFQELPAKNAVKPTLAKAEIKPKDEAPAAAEKDAPIVVAADDVSVKLQKAEQQAQAKQPVKDEPAEDSKRDAPISAEAAAKGQIKKVAPEPKKVAAVTAAPAKKVVAKDEEDAEEEAPAKTAATGSNASAILARYEAGNVNAAIELAKKSNNTELLGKLQRFQTAYEAATSTTNVAVVVKNYEAALKVDKELSSGWGKYGVEIQKALGNAYARVGEHWAKSGNNTEASKAFTKALEYDGGNSAAKDGLAALGGKSSPVADEGDKKPAAKKIAAAFGDDDDAPATPKKKSAPKAEPKPAANRAAIDNAFGD